MLCFQNLLVFCLKMPSLILETAVKHWRFLLALPWQYLFFGAVMVSMSGGAWSEISRGAAVKHFVVAALWYFLRGTALQHLSSGGGGAALTFFVGLLRHNMAPSGELLHSIFEVCIYCIFLGGLLCDIF